VAVADQEAGGLNRVIGVAKEIRISEEATAVVCSPMSPSNPMDTPRSTSHRWAAIAIPTAAFLLGLVAAVVTAKSRPQTYMGVYRQEVVAVVAQQSGRLISIDRAHGESVEPGDRLATLEDCTLAERNVRLAEKCDRLQRELDAVVAKAAVELALRNDQIEKERLETRLRYAELLRLQFDVQVRRKALQNELAEGGRAGELTNVGMQPVFLESDSKLRQLELADATNHEEVLGAQILLCEERLAALDRLQDALPGHFEHSLGIDRLRRDLSSAEEALKEIAANENRIACLSPAYGRVGIYRKQPGDFVAAGQTLVEIFDIEQPYLLLTVPLSELATLTPGRRVRVVFEGISTRKPLEGVVATVASDADRNAEAAAAPGAVMAQVRVTPSGRIWPVPPTGTAVRIIPE
jgi:multidrug resistance efflux pump